MKFLFLTFLTVLVHLQPAAQTRTCQSLHVGTFRAVSKEHGTTIIKRTKNVQVEENTHLGYKLVFAVTWINDCTYELRLKQVIKGGPKFSADAKYVITVRIKKIEEGSFTTENSSTFSNETSQHEIIIVK